MEKIQIDSTVEDFKTALKEELDAEFIEGRTHGKTKSLKQAVKELKESGTDEEYQGLIKDMFNKLNRQQQRKLVGKKNRFSHNVTKALFKRKTDV